MVKVITPENNFKNVPTKNKTITLVNNRYGYHVRLWVFSQITDAGFSWVNTKVETLATEEWNSLTEEQKEDYNNIAKEYDNSGPELYVGEIKKGSFNQEFDTDFFARQYFN